MSKFNSKKTNTTKTTNLAGGVAYKESNKLALASLLVTSFLTDKAYESEQQITKRLETLYKELLKEDKTFFAKASIYARDKFRLRSISHLASAILGEGLTDNQYSDEDKKWLVNYFNKIVMRGDDITEIISAYKSRPNAYVSKAGRIQLPMVMKHGFSKAMGKMDSYQFAKYKCENRETSMIDAVRMTHAEATDKNREALAQLVAGTLKNTETWEAKQSSAGKAGADATSKEEKQAAVAEAKKEAWSEFVAKGDKIEYMALLRNLRNILEQADESTIKKALELVQKPELVNRSKQLPFRFLTAMVELKQATNRRDVYTALDNALELSVDNCPVFPGRTAILVDVSGSMDCSCSTCGRAQVTTVAGIFAGALYKKNDSDIILFGSTARKCDVNPNDSIATIAKACLCRNEGTNMGAAFDALKESYDRIIILSDMQSWMETHSYWSSGSTKDYFNAYAKKYNPNVRLYSFDLAGNGTLQFPERNVFTIAGLSEHTFEIMGKMEEDKSYLVHEIEAIEL